MGALSGALSYLRFLVDGEPANNPGTTYERAIEARRFLPLDPAGDVMESAGWVPLEAPFDDDIAITRDLFLFGDLLCVTYREDKYVIPRALLRRETQKRLATIARDENTPREEMSRSFIKVVEGAVLQELKAKTIPKTKLVDVVWEMPKKEMRVFGRGAVATERVASLIERTFQVRVDVGSYAARAFALDLGSRNLGMLERLSPGWLFPNAIQRDASEPGVGDDGRLES